MTQKKFSTNWNSSIQPRKQRKYRYNAPLHVKQKFMHVHLSSELRKKQGTRSMQVRKGDKVKVLRGKFRKQEGKVELVQLKRERLFVTGFDYAKRDGTKVLVPLRPSNLMIVALDASDKRRQATKESKEAVPTQTKVKGGEIRK